jgi:hypothetical protein
MGEKNNSWSNTLKIIEKVANTAAAITIKDDLRIPFQIQVVSLSSSSLML